MRKYLFALLLTVISAHAELADAAHSCTGIALQNVISSPPPTVNGPTVNFAVTGPAFFTGVYLNGNWLTTYSDPSQPPGAWRQWSGQVQLPPGNHTLQADWEACVLEFNVATPPPATWITLTDGTSWDHALPQHSPTYYCGYVDGDGLGGYGYACYLTTTSPYTTVFLASWPWNGQPGYWVADGYRLNGALGPANIGLDGV